MDVKHLLPLGMTESFSPQTLRLDTSPYQRFLGLVLEQVGDGEVTIRLPFREDFLREDGSDWLHGGIISALIDIAGDYAVVTKFNSGVPTIDLRIDWLRPARAGDLVAKGRVVKAGRRVSVADVEVFDAQGQVVAVGRGLYASPEKSS
ncbi:MAG: PaaI family thioesterase [Gemmatimonadaceae bacterium]